MSEKLREMLSGFDPGLPLERARTIPADWYHEPAMAELERRSVFAGLWQVAGRAEQVAEPGSFLTACLAGEPILVVRDPQGTLRAFYNVCRHRAAQVMNEPCGKATRLRCRYHGWTYDLAGRLIGCPEWDGVEEFDRAREGLVEMAVAVWGPLVWVHPGGPPETPLAEFLAPLPTRMAGLGIERLRFAERREYTLECNWKVFVDNYLDGGYHVNTVHPGLAGVIDYSQYRTEVSGWTSVQTSPLQAKEPGDALAAVRSGTAYYGWIFPNFMLNLSDDVMDTNLVLPLGPGRCRVIFDFYFARTEGEEARRFIAQSIEVSHQVQVEDVGICEEVQRGLASRSYSTGRFSVRREASGYQFHRLLAGRLEAALGQRREGT